VGERTSAGHSALPGEHELNSIGGKLPFGLGSPLGRPVIIAVAITIGVLDATLSRWFLMLEAGLLISAAVTQWKRRG
jgi:hypothetical protein